ncbi:SRPBCC family protein [Sphaerisporangium flaviroseum]|uniref:SRPBCC family protein n=1 Tax=Sphaerisporangium flaviroseum TaxID=509199 RepID=A0ABP7JJ18_9ACTN
MKIDTEFTVSVPIDRAWEVLTDLEGIAPCMPGARLTGVDGDVYSGKVRVKVGPVVSEYAGTVRFVEKDDAGHRAVIDAKGRDSRGAGNASASITAALRADGPRTVVTVDTDLRISGKIAQFGSGMIKEVSEKLLHQFVDCLEAKLSAEAPATTPLTSPTTPQPDRAQPDTPQPDTVEEDAGQPTATQPTPTQPDAAQPTAAQPDAVRPLKVVPRVADAEPVDLMSLAGASVYKRVLPVVAAVIVIVAVVVYLLVT